jgi:hypothetical protein
MEKQPLNIIFTGPPGPGNDCVFIDVETDDGRSVRVGEWSQRQDGHWALRLSNSTTSPGSSEVTDDDLRTTFIEGADMWLNDDVLMPGLRLIADRFCSSPALAVVPDAGGVIGVLIKAEAILADIVEGESPVDHGPSNAHNYFAEQCGYLESELEKCEDLLSIIRSAIQP